MRLKSIQLGDPEIFPFKQSLSYLFASHVTIGYFFDDYHPEIVKSMVGPPEMLVYSDGPIFFSIIPVLVNPPVGLLGLDFPNILFGIATITPGKVKSILGLAIQLLSYGVLSPLQLIRKGFGLYDVITALGVRPGPARRTPAGCLWSSFYHPVVANSILTQDFTQILVSSIAYHGLLAKFLADRLIDFQDIPGFVNELLVSW